MLVYEWDETKRAANLATHGIDFEQARALEWETARHVPDLRRDHLEGRILAYVLAEECLHVIVFTIRKTGLRIISLRKANNCYVEELDRP
ncbi:MAG: BrnT family toxin [Rhodobacter sp.]|jgi:uncharacterized protein|nr:BrnT family toxin [Rhodobacter sp.]